MVLGAAALIVKLRVLETPPPGAGFETVTLAAPALAISLAAICAVNCVAETKVVVRFCPFQRTVAPLTKLLPLTVSVKAAPPAEAEAGFKVVNVGVGLVAMPAC